MRYRAFWARAGLVALFILAGCSDYNDKRGIGDAGVGDVNDLPADCINMPDGFSNICHKCDGHGHRMYSQRGDVAPVVLDDPSCAADYVRPPEKVSAPGG